jgi:hypothetical protein
VRADIIAKGLTRIVHLGLWRAHIRTGTYVEKEPTLKILAKSGMHPPHPNEKKEIGVMK